MNTAIAAGLEAHDRLLAALDQLDGAVQDAIADTLIGGAPTGAVLGSLAREVDARRTQLWAALRGVDGDAWTAALRAREAVA